MNHSRSAAARFLAAALALPLAAFVLGSCDVGSTDTTSAVSSDSSGTIYNYSGLYMNPNNGSSTNGPLPLVYPYEGTRKPSGGLITSLRLIQYGSDLEAYDSKGLTWAGSISSIQSGTASFQLSGHTTVGQAVEIAGTLVYADQKSTLDATWIEPTFYGSIFATATVSPATTNNPISGDVNLSATPSSSIALNGTVQLTASGGTKYAWELSSNAFGSLGHTGNYHTNSYTRTSGTASDSVTITVTSGGNDQVILNFI